MGKALLAIVLLLQAADDKAAVDEAIKRFNKAVANPNAAARGAAITDLSGTPHDRTLKMILNFLNADVTDVRVSAAKSMVAFGDWKKIVNPSLAAALQSNGKDYKVQVAILESLGNPKLADPVAVQTIHANLRDSDVRVALAAVAAAGTLRQKESMEVLLDLQVDVQKWLKNKQAGPYRDEKGQQGDENACKTRLDNIQKALIKAYQTITKESWATAKEWEIWWEKRKATFEIPK
jgi:HEAT repeat protein